MTDAPTVVWTHVPCPLCAADRPRLLVVDEVRRAGATFAFHVVRCGVCGMVYVTPRGTGPVFGAEAGGSARSDAAVANRPIYSAGMAHLRSAGLSSGTAVLDLGCAQGDFLAYATAAGFRAEGVDINARLAAIARGRGFTVHEGDLRALDLAPEFDAVTLWDVIEHVDDPVDVLAACRAVLKPGGLLLFHTGNAAFQIPKARLLNRVRPHGGPYLIPYQHLTHFAPATARAVLERAGLTPVEVFFAGTLHYRTARKHWAMSTLNAAGTLPALLGGPLLTNAMAAIGRNGQRGATPAA